MVEPAWLGRVAQEERAEAGPERRRTRKVAAQRPDPHRREHPGVTAQAVGAEVLLLSSLFLAVELQL